MCAVSLAVWSRRPFSLVCLCRVLPLCLHSTFCTDFLQLPFSICPIVCWPFSNDFLYESYFSHLIYSTRALRAPAFFCSYRLFVGCFDRVFIICCGSYFLLIIIAFSFSMFVFELLHGFLSIVYLPKSSSIFDENCILTVILSPTGFQRVPKSTKKRSQNLEPEKVILPDAFWPLFEATWVILGAISDPAGGRGGTKIHHNGTNLAKV